MISSPTCQKGQKQAPKSRNPGKIPENLQLNDELTPMLVCPFWSIFFDVCRKRVGLICSPFPENDGNFWIRILLPLLRRKWAYRRLFIHFIRFFPIPEHFYLQTAYGSTYGSHTLLFSCYLRESEVKRMFSHTGHTDHTHRIPLPFDSYIFSSNVSPLSVRRNHFSPNKIYVLHKSTVCTFVLPHNATTRNNRNSLSSSKLVWHPRFSWYIIYCSKASAPKVGTEARQVPAER